MELRTDRIVGRAALAASVALALLLVGTIAWITASVRGWLPSSRAPYVVGELIDVPAAVYRQTPFTIVLFARSNCGACESAVPFHQSLVTLVAGRPNARMVLVSPIADRAREVTYAGTLGLADAAVIPWPTPAPRVRAAPTLVVVNDRGVILAVWEGAGTEDEQRERMKRIGELLGH